MILSYVELIHIWLRPVTHTIDCQKNLNIQWVYIKPSYLLVNKQEYGLRQVNYSS